MVSLTTRKSARCDANRNKVVTVAAVVDQAAAAGPLGINSFWHAETGHRLTG